MYAHFLNLPAYIVLHAFISLSIFVLPKEYFLCLFLNPCVSAAGVRLAVSPPVSTSSPLRRVELSASVVDQQAPEEEQKSGEEVEMNVDSASINSAVINELFGGVLEQSDDTPSGADYGDEEDEEEDALNISSMSLLTPLAETVASVVRSPERSGLMVRWIVPVDAKESCPFYA